MFMQHIDWVYSDWTLDVSWYVMECKLLSMCVVSKGVKKTPFDIEMIQKVKCKPSFYILINLNLG